MVSFPITVDLILPYELIDTIMFSVYYWNCTFTLCNIYIFLNKFNDAGYVVNISIFV